MATLAGLAAKLGDFEVPTWAAGVREVADARRSQTAGQTALLELADLKRKQASEQEYFAFFQQHPELLTGEGGGPVLGSLGQTGGAGGQTGAITQRPLGGGPAQQIPAYPDASRYAGVSPQGGGPIPPGMAQQVMPTVTPPQSTIASLGPARAAPADAGAAQSAPGPGAA